ncbi:long chain acyl-CoA synthetase 9, chloroplastic-like [Penaeus monodon]|uniref:long chain acyl-CoA synthetase 9, chloroplastic-like n=1 Tax=Penaeus monodon TaxID=6687 RepID=UPI0018A7D454|nr:long chain acyl-CoA synthetase 9, chloroplastic-like [Penaeus monodon]
MEKLHLGEYSFLTYREVQDMVVSFSQGLAKIGTGNSGRVAIFAETCAEWFTAVMGCLRQGLTVVTVFPNLSVEEIVASLCETEVSVIMTSHDLLSRTAEVVRKCPAITNVIVFEDQLEGVGTVPEGLMEVVIPYKDVVETGKYLNTSLRQPTGSDVAIIMYTSGSIDRPKGTELTHDNIVSSIISFAIQADLRSGDRFLAFLPLAHVMEFTTEIALVSLGIVVMYGSPMTLTSSCPKIMEGTLSDAQVAKPTCINAAPLILDRIVTQAMEKCFLNNQISEKALTCDVQGS